MYIHSCKTLSNISRSLKEHLKSFAEGKCQNDNSSCDVHHSSLSAATKLLGYVGHTGRVFKKFCLRPKTGILEFRTSCANANTPKEQICASTSRLADGATIMYHGFDVIKIECNPSHEHNYIYSA